MPELITGKHKMCGEIAEAFGIKHCRSIEIYMHIKDIVKIKAEFYPEADGVKKLETILKEYGLKELR